MWDKVAIAIASVVGFGQGLPPADLQLHKQLDWKGPEGCVVDFVHTPCRTVHYHESSFGSSLGSEGVWRAERIEAVDHDGSESRTTTFARRRYWFLPEQTKKIAELVLRTENRTVIIDHDRRVFETHLGGANKNWAYWEEDDLECSYTKSHYLYLSDRLQDSVIAGVHVVGYRGRDNREADYEVYFAPSIGCQEMRFQMVMRGLFGREIAKYEMVVDSYEIGPPSSKLFTLPAGYKQATSILHP